MTIDKDKLKQQVTEMEAKLAEMKELLNKPDVVINYWQPSVSKYEQYFFVNYLGQIKRDCANDKSLSRYRVFKTESEALKYAEYVKAEETLKRVIAEANEGWLPDWSNSDECKSYVTLLIDKPDFLTVSKAFTTKTQHNFMYIKTQQLANTLISKYQNEFLTYLSY